MNNILTHKSLVSFVLLCALAIMSLVAPLAQAHESTDPNHTHSEVTTMASTSASTTPTTNPTIAGLLAQLAKLTALFNELKAKLAGTQAEIKELRGDIREGMSDNDVKTIQELLASDPTVYPTGLVTGYFGPMTKEAIKRFQAKNGLEVTGEIDTETKAAMDSIIEARRAEGKFPVGLLLAPGMKERFENRLKNRCEDAATSTVSGAVCERIKTKYKFEVDDKGRVKMESKMEKKMSDDDSDDLNDDDEDDDRLNDHDEDDDHGGSHDESDDDNDSDEDDN